MALSVYFPAMHVMERSVWPGWPVWNPRGESLFQQLQRDMRSEIERMERIFRGVDQLSSHTRAPGSHGDALLQQPAVSSGFQIEDPQEQGGGFVASLDVQDFSPQDLAVKVSGDKLVVAGRREVKSGEVSSGSYSHSCQEFHRETQLPRDVDPQSVSCCLTEDGKLKFKAQRRALPAAAERVVVIEQPATATPGTASQSTGTTHA
uniref:Heat shock protein beta-11-like n=2 Tax=Petromyzon marinus TaxID=7757 RepID=A0AAJ7WJT3_PETMA|nr:heat shock protein beta-11-like [Petromyzon marinus]XP_032800210.1 heat shock protein beta-11-like [Petromyzon marinus]